ncbi:hypothetical protein TWF730_008786 [Orbilia blumenaviensis]|uniref:F-box domain-containing protein n=1 Tax=Orbilia blumenaviensis TaxID=1796055 RepID=A0AAV9V3P5_9PEZI
MSNQAHVPIASIPLELFLPIVSYLHIKDAKNLSLALKSFRTLLIPYLFHNVKICPESIAGFGRGGSLSHIGSLVQQLTLYTANSGFADPDVTCNFLRSCLNGADLGAIFPNTTRLTIMFIPELDRRIKKLDLERRILRAIFMGLSKFSFYHNIKTLDFVVSTIEGENVESDDIDSSAYLRKFRLSQESWDFIGPAPEENRGRPNSDYCFRFIDRAESEELCPSSLIELNLTSLPGSSREVNNADHLGPGILHAIRPAADQLQKLQISAVPPIVRPSLMPPHFWRGVRYPNVRDFSFHINVSVAWFHIGNAVYAVPNVERINLTLFLPPGSHIILNLPPQEGSDSQIPLFSRLAGLQKLRKVVIDAPMEDRFTEDHRRANPEYIVRQPGHISIAAAIKSVTYWLNSGLKDLESVDFRFYFIPKNKSEGMHEILELYCDVVRELEGETWRLEWRSVRRSVETGEVNEDRFSSLPSFYPETYMANVGIII